MLGKSKIPKASLSLVSLRFREILQYRAAAWAGVFTQVVFGFILPMILLAFYASSDTDPSMGSEQLIVYIWLGQTLFTLMPWSADRSVVEMVRTGSVAYELARPIDTYLLWFSRTMGWRLGAVVSRGLPLIVIVAVGFPLAGLHQWALPAPVSVAAMIAFTAALGVSVFLATALTMLMHGVILWTPIFDCWEFQSGPNFNTGPASFWLRSERSWSQASKWSESGRCLSVSNAWATRPWRRSPFLWNHQYRVRARRRPRYRFRSHGRRTAALERRGTEIPIDRKLSGGLKT